MGVGFDALADLLEELDTGSFDLTITGFDEVELERIMTWAPPEISEPEEALVSSEESPPIAKLGDVYQLGEHILICGDATDPAVWGELKSLADLPALSLPRPLPWCDMGDGRG